MPRRSAAPTTNGCAKTVSTTEPSCRLPSSPPGSTTSTGLRTRLVWEGKDRVGLVLLFVNTVKRLAEPSTGLHATVSRRNSWGKQPSLWANHDPHLRDTGVCG